MPTRKPDIPEKKYRGCDNATADLLVETMAKVGTNRSTIKACGIPQGTFYEWLRFNPDLKLRITIAKREFMKNRCAENIDALQQHLAKLAHEGIVTTKETYDNQGKLVKKEITKSPPPQWLFDRFLGSNDEQNALKTLAENGFIPDAMAMSIIEKLDTAKDEIKTIFEKSLAPPGV